MVTHVHDAHSKLEGCLFTEVNSRYWTYGDFYFLLYLLLSFPI